MTHISPYVYLSVSEELSIEQHPIPDALSLTEFTDTLLELLQTCKEMRAITFAGVASSGEEIHIELHKLSSNLYPVKNHHHDRSKTFPKSDSLENSSPTCQHPVEKSRQEQFLKEVYEIIEENFGNPGFQISDLATKLFMSRTQLYRRLKSITGKNFTTIQRELKVNKICHLLKSTDLTISEISHKLGFRDPSYMSRTFRKIKKMSPSTYQLTHNQRRDLINQKIRF